MRAEGVEDGIRRRILDRDRKERPEDHIERNMAGLALHIDGAAIGQGFQPLDARERRIPHRGQHVLGAATVKGRVDDPALPFPFRPVGDEDRMAQKRRQPLEKPQGFREILGAAGQDQIDQIGVVAQEGGEEGRVKFGHPGAEHPGGLHGQDVLPDQAKEIARADTLGPGGGLDRAAMRKGALRGLGGAVCGGVFHRLSPSPSSASCATKQAQVW